MGAVFLGVTLYIRLDLFRGLNGRGTFSTTNFLPFRLAAIARATPSNWVRSTEPSSAWGVPTQINITFVSRIAVATSGETLNLPDLRCLSSASWTPGSKNGAVPVATVSVTKALSSAPITCHPSSAKLRAVGNPTWPSPRTEIDNGVSLSNSLTPRDLPAA